MRPPPAKRLLIRCQPIGDVETEADGIPDQGLDRAAGLDRDGVARPYLIGWTVGTPAIDQDMAVRHELTGLGPRAAEAQPVDDVVEALFELAQQLLPGCLRSAAAGIEIALELAGRHAAEPLDLLLLFELDQVVRVTLAGAALLSGAALLPRRKRPPGLAALAGDLAGPLEPEFDAGSPGEFFERSTGSHEGPIPLNMGLLNPALGHFCQRRPRQAHSTSEQSSMRSIKRECDTNRAMFYRNS